MIAPHAIQRHPSNAQPRLRVLHSGCRRACWAMMMRQARRSSAIQHYTVRCGFLSQRSYVAPSRQRRSSSKRPRKELTYCPIYGFKSFLICAKDLTPALFCLHSSDEPLHFTLKSVKNMIESRRLLRRNGECQRLKIILTENFRFL